MSKKSNKIQRDDLNSDEEDTNEITEIKEVVKAKVGRKHNVKSGDEIIVEKPEVETISHSKAKKLLKERKPFVASEKQLANTARLVALNKAKREAKVAAEELEKAKLKQKKLVVLPKRERKVKAALVEPVEEDETSEEEMPTPVKVKKARKEKVVKVYDDQTDGDTTDTRQIKKKIEKIKLIDETVKMAKHTGIANKFF